MINQTLWYSTALASHLKKLDFTQRESSEFGQTKLLERIDVRTRNDDYHKALSFEIFDPLWMLCRQWQYGRFKAVDCGTPVMVKVKTEKRKLDGIQYRDDADQAVNESYFTDKPLEYDVEKQNVEITPYVRVQSAMQLKKMLLANGLTKKDFAFLYGEAYKLHDELAEAKANDKNINSLKIVKNSSLKDFYNFYGNRSFDGYKVFEAFTSDTGIVYPDLDQEILSKIVSALNDYVDWFKNKFLPCGDNQERNYWSNEKLGYELRVKQGEDSYSAEDYDTGRLSWYSFDYSNDKKDVNNVPKDDESSEKSITKMLSYIPTPAKIPGAPATRLWEFEDRRVNMGNCDTDFSFIGTAAIMQYVSMFSNDWMIMPLETETGTILDVKGIVVKDSFGDRFYIDRNAQKLDRNKDDDIYTDRWNLFGTSFDNAYRDRKFSTSAGLLFPPTVLRCDESKPIEEVQFLRDEMANMVWGVETTVNNRCGGTMDGRTLSDQVLSSVDEFNLQQVTPQDESQEQENTGNSVEAEYSLLIQNRVPMNWIPFIPEQLQGQCREIALRRARMPVFYNGDYRTVAPSTDLIGYKRDAAGHVKALYINEEEIATCGIKIIKTAQRTRWFLGKSFNWIGNKEVISEYQANSGLMFDELISKKTGKAIKLQGPSTESESATQETQEIQEESPR